MRRALKITLLLVLLTPVFAQESSIVNALLTLDTWTAEMNTRVDAYAAGFNTLALALTALGFIASLLGVLLKGSLGGLNLAFLRLMLATAVISLTPALTALSVGTWQALRDWSGGAMIETFNEGADELAVLAGHTSILTFAMGGGAAKILSQSAQQAAMASGKAAANNVFSLINIMVIPIAMIGLIGHFMMLGAGLAVFICCAFLPVAGGMLAFSPQQGGEFMGRVTSGIIGALLITAFMPLVFAAVFNLTVVQPVAAVNDEFASFSDFFSPAGLVVPARITELENAIARDMEELAELEGAGGFLGLTADSRRRGVLRGQIAKNEVALFAERNAWTTSNVLNVNNVLQAVGNSVARWGTTLLIMFIAILMSTGLVLWGARVAGSLGGGIIGGRMTALAAGGLGALAGFGAAGARPHVASGGSGGGGAVLASGGSGGGAPSSGTGGFSSSSFGPSAGGGRGALATPGGSGLAGRDPDDVVNVDFRRVDELGSGSGGRRGLPG